MPQGETLRVVGYRDLLRAFQLADREQKKALRDTLREVGGKVRTGASLHVLDDKGAQDAKTAAGYKVYVRQRGVAVEQSLPRTTGLHPEWGAWQMRHALLPSLVENEAETEHRMESALDEIATRFNAGVAI